MDILSETQWPAKQTNIMKNARLNHRQITRYLTRLMTRRLIWRDEAREVYQLTDKGQRYQREYAEYQKLKDGPTAEKEALEQRRAALRRFFRDT